MENATLVVRNGKIVSVGRGVGVPADLPLIHLPDAILCPGFVSAACNVAGIHQGDQTVSGAYHAVDAYDRYGLHARLLAGGVTTAHLDPGGHRLVSGVGAVVKLGGPADQRILQSASDLSVNLDAFNPPPLTSMPFYASSDEGILPAELQRPRSRMGRFAELRERIGFIGGETPLAPRGFDYHNDCFSDAWRAGLPLRVQARRAADILAGADFLKKNGRQGYLVGLAEGDRVVEELLATRLALVLRLEREFRFPGPDLGPQADVMRDDLEVAAALERPELRLALAGGDSNWDHPQMVGLLARRGGMSANQALASLTRIPAEILGIADRLGSLEPGKDADFLVLSGPPLEVGSSVLTAYIAGRPVFEAPHSGPDRVLIKAGTVWVGDGQQFRDAELLIEDGRIKAVGSRVPSPPFTRMIDAGPNSFVTPGFIDAHSHLGLAGDMTVAGPELPVHETIGTAGREFVRVARAGVTTVLLSAYKVSGNGGRVSAVKTAGESRSDRVVREIAGLKLDLSNLDPAAATDSLKQLIERGKKYAEQWTQYYEALKKWEADRAAGVTTKPAKAAEEVVVEAGKVDPITGTWDFRVSGGPLPEAVHGTLRLKLTGTQIEGRATVPMAEEEAVLKGSLDGDRVRLEFEEDTEVGKPMIEATLDREDHMQGQLKLGALFALDFDATRVSKEPVEFKVSRKKRSKDGRPVPPKLDEALEPLRPILAKEAPLVIRVRDASQAEAALKLLVDEHQLPVVLLNADEVSDLGEKLTQRGENLGVVAPPEPLRMRKDRPYNQAADLAGRGVKVSLQSDGEDAARNLPLVALWSVQQGFGADDALRSLTSNAARMFKLDDRIGTLAPGKDADLLIFSGHPFDAGSRLLRVFVNGKEPPELEEAP